MITVGLNNVCINVTIANSLCNVIHTVSSLISWLSYVYLKQKPMKNIEWCLKLFFYLVCGENALCSPQTLAFIWYDSWSLFTSLSCWRHEYLCPTMFSIFTHCVVNFEISSIISGFCTAMEWNVTLFPV